MLFLLLLSFVCAQQGIKIILEPTKFMFESEHSPFDAEAAVHALRALKRPFILRLDPKYQYPPEILNPHIDAAIRHHVASVFKSTFPTCYMAYGISFNKTYEFF